MGKTLFWIVVFFGLLLATRFIAHQAAKKRFRDEQHAKQPHTPPLPKTEEMVSCAHCGVFLPRSEALVQSNDTWCSQAHARLGPSPSR